MFLNRVYLGKAEELLKEIPDNIIDLVIIDPDYDISVCHGSGAFGVKKKISFKQIEGISKGFDFAILDELCRVMKKINIYIFCSKKQIIPLLDYFVTKRNCYFDLLPWHKTNPVPTCNNKYLPDTEHCLFFRQQGVPLYGDFYSKRTYYLSQSNKADKKKYGHPTIKPSERIKDFIVNSSKEGEIVLDCFLGSGTTAVAAKELNRNFIGIESVPERVLIAEKRLSETVQQLSLLKGESL